MGSGGVLCTLVSRSSIDFPRPYLDTHGSYLSPHFRHRCPHCQAFAPHYEKVAQFFSLNKKQPDITIARIDCPDNQKICEEFTVKSYPTLKIGLAADFASKRYDNLVQLEAKHTFKGLITALEDQLSVQFDTHLVDTVTKAEDQQPASGDAIDKDTGTGEQQQQADKGGTTRPVHRHILKPRGNAPIVKTSNTVDLIDIQGSTIMSWQYMASSHVLLQGLEARQALLDWVGLLAIAHPTPQCRQGAADVRDELDELWPLEVDGPTGDLKEMAICPGLTFRDGDWGACKGSIPEMRGYTCGLWQLLHSLSVNLPESEGNIGAVWLAAVKGFIQHYFVCSECAQHFVEYATSEEAIEVISKKDAVMWLWKTHNVVNQRLAGEEERENKKRKDVRHPKVQWPTVEVCPQCVDVDGGGWDEEAVYSFMLEAYSLKEAVKSGGGRTTQSGWLDAVFIVVVVGGLAYAALSDSGQYKWRGRALKKNLL